jgi:hypothetical protein
MYKGANHHPGRPASLPLSPPLPPPSLAHGFPARLERWAVSTAPKRRGPGCPDPIYCDALKSAEGAGGHRACLPHHHTHPVQQAASAAV